MKIHPRSFSLKQLALPMTQAHRDLLGHLVVCERCRRQLAAIQDPGQEPFAERLAEVLPWPTRTKEDYSAAIAAAESRLLARARSLESERAFAPIRLAELLEQPPERREMLIRNHPRFQSWGLLEQLLATAREQFFLQPQSAEGLARLALCLADALDADFYGEERIEDLRARTWGYIGNARRIRSDHPGAVQAFDSALSHLRRGTGDPLERALLLELRAALFRAQRRFETADRLLLRALEIYAQVGETRQAGRILVSRALVREQAGEPELAIPLLQEALAFLDPEQDPRLLWTAHHNLITSLAEAGRFMEARRLFIQARPLYARFSDGDVQNRRHWVAGKIARGFGQSREAEACFNAAREGFIAGGMIFDAAGASLDLAALYAKEGRNVELQQIAEEMLAVFTSQHIHREALAALSFLHQAVLAERASLEVVTGVAAFLHRLDLDPSLAFAQPPGDQ